MPPLTIVPALARLRGAGAGAAPLTGTSEVWALVRFDYDNTKMEIFWSEKNVAGASTVDSTGARAYGSHAEPVFLRNYTQMVADYGVPLFIEVFLSRSPCANGSAITAAHGVGYPVGCGPKLRAFAAAHPAVTVQVIYDVVYAGNPAAPSLAVQAASLNELSQWAGIANLTASLFNHYTLVP
ncbi:hypothetical protein [Acidicapsa acidisoli]|uniref:hypothetical protein n=1 Tax=Acidicapsa acidisoli TaxID=1615681 RepID=UPI0021DF5CA2|nr:hypothetical protein [Acidicapsa acidisoli]